MRSSNLLDHFSALEDPRQSWKTVYPLEEVLLIVLAGVMAGADDFVEISYWAERKLRFFAGSCRSRPASLHTTRSKRRDERSCPMRDNWLSNRVFKNYDDILDHCCQAWNNLVSQPERITSIGTRKWAHGF